MYSICRWATEHGGLIYKLTVDAELQELMANDDNMSLACELMSLQNASHRRTIYTPVIGENNVMVISNNVCLRKCEN